MASALPHLLLVNLGTPIAPTAPAVRDFLEEFLGDPAVVDFPRWFWAPILYGIVLRTRPARVAEQYHAIWSPLNGTAGSPSLSRPNGSTSASMPIPSATMRSGPSPGGTCGTGWPGSFPAATD